MRKKRPMTLKYPKEHFDNEICFPVVVPADRGRTGASRDSDGSVEKPECHFYLIFHYFFGYKEHRLGAVLGISGR